jgi:hypothetical protein
VAWEDSAVPDRGVLRWCGPPQARSRARWTNGAECAFLVETHVTALVVLSGDSNKAKSGSRQIAQEARCPLIGQRQLERGRVQMVLDADLASAPYAGSWVKVAHRKLIERWLAAS